MWKKQEFSIALQLFVLILLNEIVTFNMVSDFRNLVAIESFHIIELRLSEIH